MSKPVIKIRRRGDRDRVSISFGDVSRAVQSEQKNCDINYVMQRYRNDGIILHLNHRTPTYGDFSAAPDFQTARNLVIEAEQSFLALPSHIRNRFQNDPGQFLDFMHDPANKDEIARMGLSRPETASTEPPAPPATPTPRSEAKASESKPSDA